jgi:hypothetical protein
MYDRSPRLMRFVCSSVRGIDTTLEVWRYMLPDWLQGVGIVSLYFWNSLNVFGDILPEIVCMTCYSVGGLIGYTFAILQFGDLLVLVLDMASACVGEGSLL